MKGWLYWTWYVYCKFELSKILGPSEVGSRRFADLCRINQINRSWRFCQLWRERPTSETKHPVSLLGHLLISMNVISFLKNIYSVTHKAYGSTQTRNHFRFHFFQFDCSSCCNAGLRALSISLAHIKRKEYIVKRWLAAVTFDFVSAKIVVDIGHGYWSKIKHWREKKTRTNRWAEKGPRS